MDRHRRRHSEPYRADGGSQGASSTPARTATADDRLAPTEDVPRDAVLALEDVDSGYGELQVLYDLSVHLGGEEIVCLIGPNGAGKSTVLRTAFGLNAPWSGEVYFDGEPIGGTEPADLVRMGLGFVPQTDNVFGSLTVEENLRMGGVARESGLGSVIETLYDRFSILDEKRRAKAKTLSGGQRQVLALARALVMEPDVLFVDEPSAGLAPSIVDEVFENVRTVNDMGTSVLMVEQNARDGLAISDRGYVLDQGTVRFEGPADELLDNPQVSELYLGG
ncbi:ABC transporter ATP-binding protein [Halovivax sp.]|uniref:ABC transporter ATP-binding protein n=1 Tax=Halovivax sp. TaxID=1935978 RepID=UPI0025C190D1|nr:ABC transporter ATP-binding protein [Halovivax sp.]